MSSALRHLPPVILFRKDYVSSGLFTRIQALFMLDLIELSRIIDKTPDDFFPCPVQYLKESLSWDSDTQSRMLSHLTEKGFVDVKRMGLPSCRYVRVHIDKIEDAIDQLTDTTT